MFGSTSMVFICPCDATRLLALMLRNLGLGAIPISVQMTQDYIHRAEKTALFMGLHWVCCCWEGLHKQDVSGVAISLVNQYELEWYMQMENLLSLRDAEEATPNSSDYEEWGAPKADNSLKSKNRSGWLSGDNVTGIEELRRENYNYKNTPEEPEAGAGAEEGEKVGVGAAAGEGAGLGAGTGIGDRRTDLRISTQVCRDFPPGKCRRGSDCHVARFFHPNAANHGDGGQSEDNLAERLSSRPECGHISTYTESEGDNYDRGTRSTSFDHGQDNQSSRTGNFAGNLQWGSATRIIADFLINYIIVQFLRKDY
ncbi:hypothetical protein T459_12347 [Capsicum annuum]|uniref:C3H1-type domain-containing protein n=1 Tax=Capsicum annuum TaxID=4072 RepID=A0A2G2ZPN2_CAPAN|nr:hypothetical protein T459_12347 [Capsicum annuum]